MNVIYGLTNPYFAPWIFMVIYNTINFNKPLKSTDSQSWVQNKGVCANFVSQNSFEKKFLKKNNFKNNIIFN